MLAASGATSCDRRWSLRRCLLGTGLAALPWHTFLPAAPRLRIPRCAACLCIYFPDCPGRQSASYSPPQAQSPWVAVVCETNHGTNREGQPQRIACWRFAVVTLSNHSHRLLLLLLFGFLRPP